MKYCCWLLILLGCSFIGRTQQTNEVVITANFIDADIESFVAALEEQSKLRVYYDPALFDSFHVTMQVKEMPIKEVLSRAFAGTDFYASFDQRRTVFLTKGAPIVTVLPKRNRVDSVISSTEALLEAKRAGDEKELFANEKIHRIGAKSPLGTSNNATLHLTIVDAQSAAANLSSIVVLDGKVVAPPGADRQVYRLQLSTGRHELSVNAFGKQQATRRLLVEGDGSMIVALEDEVKTLQDVTVTTQQNTSINNTSLGVERLTIKAIKRVPVVFGEADVLKVILTLPGVKSTGEAGTGFNVRGGGTDQNLILFNNASIYNPAHFFGFFSAFNPEMVKDVALFKSSIPAKYGGRLSSVLNITAREGNTTKYTGSAGIGLVTSRLNVEGPIIRDKASFNFGARTTYANWLLKLLPENYRNSAASFYDLNLITSFKMGPRSDLQLNGYASGDQFRLNSDTLFGYQNRSVSAKFSHSFTQKLAATFLAGLDDYGYQNTSESNGVNAYRMSFGIRQYNLKSEFVYTLNERHAFEFGAGTIYYSLRPGSFMPVGKASMVTPVIIDAEQALESAAYISHKFDVSKKLSFSSGLRYMLYHYLGPRHTNIYAPNQPKNESTFIGVMQKGAGEVLQTYQGPDWRFSAKYSLTPNTSLKAGYNTLRQFIHMLSNTTAISPTDIWKLSDNNIRPQFGTQVSLGLFKNFGKDSIETSLEVYYKRMEHILDYRSGAQLVLNREIERDVINAKGKAYGVELMVKKKSGKLNGWFGYSYSRTLLKMDDLQVGPLVNMGEYYPANYDKPHDGTLAGNYALNQRFSVSLNITYSTGRPITLPIGSFFYSGSERALYSDRNAYRIPDYFRSDFSMNIEGNHKVHQLTHNSFTIGIYNITGRKNPYSVYYTSENGVISGYKLSIFGSMIPFINYNIRF
ncbi:TonB-dependent receptor plug domain-containing protein [Pseudocnuella soli]|uniref:TonB-dependent receptor plug domain-containing protein n=1 Tax=Pseudocnuella soli TaxID=2502779 RepID=UPI00104F541E|nr:TonB-dependent receptor plug domain-containing protein [Pseudocnuella soli]